MDVHIVPINESHIESFRESLDAVARERMYLVLVESPPLAAVRDYVMRNIAGDAAHFVAVEGSRVVGWCDIVPGLLHAVRHRGTVGMGVIASHRGQGIGKRLLAACLAKARVRGIRRAQLEARSDNVVAIQLYERSGFVREATLRDAMLLDGKLYETVQMSLILDP